MSTTELLEIRRLARSFAEAELRPHAERWDAARALDDDVVAKIADLGFPGMLVPESAGGMGFGLTTYLAALEELAWGEPGAAMIVTQTVAAADILLHADADATLIGELAAGTRVGCIAFAEDDAGTDLSTPATRAERRGDGWVVTGRKRWVTNGARADLAIVLAATGDSTGEATGARAALFSVGTEGRTVGGTAPTMGLRSAPVTDLTFDDAPAVHLMDVTGDPRAQVDAIGRLSVAAIAVGIAQAALDHAVAYAAERHQFGQPLRAFEGIQFKLAEMATRTAAARALVERAAALTDAAPADGSGETGHAGDYRGRDAAAAMAKLAAGEAAMYVTTEAVQVFGGYGYMKDYPVEKLMRDAKAMDLVHGTSEMQRLRIAAALYAD